MSLARRSVAAGLGVVVLSAGLTVLAMPAVADSSCRTDPSGDVVDPAGQPVLDDRADMIQHCVTGSNGRVELAVTFSTSGGPVQTSGTRTLRWEVTGWTSPESGDPVVAAAFTVISDESGARLYFRSDVNDGRLPLCTAQPTADAPEFYSVVFPGWCFTASRKVSAVPTVTVTTSPDPDASRHGDTGDTPSALVDNVLEPVDRRYSDLGGARSGLGLPVTEMAYGQNGTTARRLFKRGLISYSEAVSTQPVEVLGLVYPVYQRVGEEAGPLGRPLFIEEETLDRLNQMQRFEGGVISSFWGGYEVHGAIGQLYAPGGARYPELGALGYPMSDELPVSDGVGRFNRFQNGSIYWSPGTGAHAVLGQTLDKWLTTGATAGPLGYPTSGTYTSSRARILSRFQGGAICTTSAGIHEAHGAIAATWFRLKGEFSPLICPITDELATPDGRGRFNHFEGGSVYWTPTTGAQEVRGAIRETWARQGWEVGSLGYPTTDELAIFDSRGRYNHFQGGAVYWTPTTGAHAVQGAIRQAWQQSGEQRGTVGYPLTSELTAPDGVGRFNHFEGGSVYWSPGTGAHPVYGAIRAFWSAAGWERSSLGYPTSAEFFVPGGRAQEFQRGRLTWQAATGKVTATSR